MDESRFGDVLMYLVRHAEVDLDVEERIRGTQNVPLNEAGERESEELRDFFDTTPISAVFSDDLDRTFHTAISIANAHHLQVHKDILLRSWDVGSDLEGKSIAANRLQIREFKLQPQLVPLGGESWAHAEQRAVNTLAKYTAIALESPAPIVLVLHGSMLQLLWKMLGMEQAGPHEYDETPIEPSGIIAVYASRKGYRARILRLAKETADA